MPKLLQKTIFSLLSFLILFGSIAPNFLLAQAAPKTPPPASSPAQLGAWYNTGFGDWYQKVYDENVSPGSEIFGERYTAAQVQWVIYGVMAFVLNAILGNSPESQQVISCLIGTNKDATACGTAIKALLSSAGSVTPIATTQEPPSLLSMVFADRPLSGVTYIKHGLQNFSLVPTANAQTTGFGFGALEPIRSMWRGARDISFGLFVIAAIVMAFMIMFRVKISPQVVISVQSAIPKLIIAIILVTFSYAIAGFMVDLMYVVIGIISLLAPSLTVFKVQPQALFAFLTGSNILLILAVYMFAMVIAFIGSAAALMGAPLFAVLTATMIVLLWWLILLLVIILVIVFIFIAVKTIWSLLKAFAGILISVIFGPFQIVGGVLVPTLGFGPWLKGLAANLSVFVVTGALMLLSFVFLINGVMLGMQDFFGGPPGAADLGATILHFVIGTAVAGQVTGSVSGNWPPLLGAGNSLAGVGMVFLGASVVVFSLIPKASDIIKAFMEGKPFSYGSAVGEALGPGIMAGQAYGDYRSGIAKARNENQIRQMEHEAQPNWDRIGELRQEQSQRDFATGILNRFLKGK